MRAGGLSPCAWLLAAALPALLASCASTPYAFAAHGETDLTLRLREGEPQIERGEPNAWLDGFGHYFFSLPTKLVLLDWRVDDHRVSKEVEASIHDYLAANGLCNTKVRINEYAPGGEWQRLFHNREMPGGWRFTLGLLSVSFYTIFPDRLFAGFPFLGVGDQYNPYTNTISLYSNRRAIGLHEGGHAKDFASVASRHWRGLYAGARSIPIAGMLVALVQEAAATNDALSWELATDSSRESQQAYRTLYPAYGTYLGGAAENGAALVLDGWIPYAIQYGVVLAGHVVGQTRALLEPEREQGLEMGLLERSPAPADEDALPASITGRRRGCPPPALERLTASGPEPAPPAGPEP